MHKRTACVLAALTWNAAPVVHAVELIDEEGATFELFGNLQFVWSSVETAEEEGGSEALDQLADNGSTLGALGERSFGDGLTGYFRYEFEGDADEIKNGGGLDTGDRAYFGVKGAFGDLRIGSWDPLIDDLVQDPLTDNEFFDLTDSNGRIEGDDGVNTQGDTETDREGDRIQYTSPAFAGFSGTIGLQYKGDAEEENGSGSGSVAPYLGVAYDNGALAIGAVWDSLDNYDGDTTGRVFLAPDGSELGDFDAGEQFGVSASYAFEALTLATKVEYYASGDTDSAADELRLGISARFGHGRGDVYGAYQYVDVGEVDAPDPATGAGAGLSFVEDDTTYNEFMLGATYEIFEDAYVFAETAAYDREDDVDDGIALGAVYLF